MILGVGTASATPGVTSKTITLGLILPVTGPSASEEAGTIPAAQARIDVANAQGGIYGRKIKLITKDDGTNPATNQAATSALISQGVFGIIDISPVAFGGYKVAQQAGVPVTGGAFDGPEWYEKANSNMFTFTGQNDPKDPQYAGLAQFMKSHGGNNCGSVGYSISPSSTAAASGFILTCKAVGLKKAYLNNTLPFGTVNTTALALQLKAAKVNALYLPLDANTNFAIMTSLKQVGYSPKVIVNATGYGQPLLNDTAALPNAQGAWFETELTPVEVKTPATEAFQAALAKYAHFTGVPDFGWYYGWAATDLMLYGLKLAGKNPTQAGFINALHKVTNYDVGGLGFPVSFKPDLIGKAPKQLCGWYVQLKGAAYVNPTKVCGKLVPNSDQLPSA